MEEDYKNLKEIIDLCEEEIEKNDENTHATLDIIDLKSLRNILKTYKELEKLAEGLKKIKELTLKPNTDFVIVASEDYLPHIKPSYIHKSLIKEKIEQLEGKDLTINLSNRNNGETFQQAVRNTVIQVLQEVLEG